MADPLSEELLAADSRKFKVLHPSANIERKKQYIFDVNDLDLDHMTHSKKLELLEMLEKFESMCDGHLGEINITKHRIELLSGTTPNRQQPYWTGMRAKESEAKEIERMLRENVIVHRSPNGRLPWPWLSRMTAHSAFV